MATNRFLDTRYISIFLIHYPGGISQERMTYIPASAASDGRAKVIYQAKDGRERKVFPALDWLAQLTTHVPNRREHMVRYYGYYSNKSRGQRKKAGEDEDIAHIIDTGLSNKAFRKSWARLIQKVGACPGPDPGKWIRYCVPSARGK